jgi:hypothetical protein
MEMPTEGFLLKKKTLVKAELLNISVRMSLGH